MRARAYPPRIACRAAILSLGVLASVLTVGCGDGAPLAPVQVPAVTPSDVDSVSVQPPSVEVSQLNERVQFTATALNASGAIVHDAPVSWASSDITVATVNQDGTVTILHGGEATITATYGGATGSATVTVTPTLNP